MKGILLLNGQPFDGAIDDNNAFVYCCDGAYRWAKGKVRIDKNIGDYDSLGYLPDPPPETIYPAEKNFTDGEIALYKMLDGGIDEIEIYGGGGGRDDHFLGNLHLLYAAFNRGAQVRMITQTSVIFPAGGEIPLNGLKGKTISVFPFGSDLHIIKSTGLKYPYPETLAYGECRGVSNVALSDRAALQTREGETALIIVNRGRV